MPCIVQGILNSILQEEIKMEQEIYLYKCTRCKLLLMKLDDRSIVYESTQLSKDGEYRFSNNPESGDSIWLCPICSGASENDDNLEETLEDISVSVETIPKLLALWEELILIIVTNNQIVFNYGIPLDNKELKTILFEDKV